MTWLRQNLRDSIASSLIFASLVILFWLSPVKQVTDSKYSMLLSESLIKHRTFSLDNYNFTPLEPLQREDYVMYGDIYQIEVVRERRYYFFPPGSAVLSIPYVFVANLLGVSAANPDGTYNHRGEIVIESGLAAILMALLGVIFFLTSRLLLPIGWSLVIAFGSTLGTQVWSTASRALWSHTWGMLLLGGAILLLAGLHLEKLKPRPILLATVLAWLYFVRPTNSIFIIGIAIFIFLFYRKLFVRFALTGAAWFALFVIYSWYNFGKALPSYYAGSRLQFDVFGAALAGNLISPGRGLLVFSPIVLFVIFLVVRYRKAMASKRLMWLAASLCLVNLLVVSGFSHWWGGAGYGPRLLSDMVPWLVLLAILGVDAWLRWRKSYPQAARSFTQIAQFAGGAALLLFSVFAHARGATDQRTWKWNERAESIPQVLDMIWDWRQTQFLAGLVRPPLKREYPLVTLGNKIEFRSPAADKYLWYGWSGAEKIVRWTEGNEAALIFRLSEVRDLLLRMKVRPFVSPGLLTQQRLKIELNNHALGDVVLDQQEGYELTFKLDRNQLATDNVLRISLPDANSPYDLGLSIDERRLGIAAEWMQFQTP